MTIQNLIDNYEKELIVIETSQKKNYDDAKYYMSFACEEQAELVRRFINDLKKLLV